MTPEELDAVIAELSEAQRRWLLDAWYGRHGWQINYRKKACDLGLCYPGTSRLTYRGYALRERLMEQGRG